MFFKIKFTIFKHDFLKSNKIFINNNLISSKEKNLLKDFCFNIFGENNEIYLENINQFENLTIEISGNNNKVTIKKSDYKINGLSIKISGGARGSEIFIDENVFVNGFGALIIRGKGHKITIGKNCMLAHGAVMTTTDWHSVYDNKTNELLNPDEDIIIKDNVWLGLETLINKGAIIPDNCIVGAKSFVNKKFDEPNCLIAGTPARVVKRGVRWER